ncbi:MAG: DUF445 family protein [Thermodesulfobacteriota bacterium]
MDFVRLALPPAFGFLIGFATNALAIRMLFRPYREVRVLGLRFHGMIPRRKADIAATVSRTVVSELLKEQSVARRLGGPEVRSALRRLVLELLERYLGREYGSLLHVLGPERARAVERELVHLACRVGDAAERWLQTPEGVGFLEHLLGTALERSPADLLRGEERLAIQVAVGKVAQFLADPDLEAKVRPAVARALVALASSPAPLGDLLPEGVRSAGMAAVRSAVPALLRRFEEALLSASNVEKIKAAVRSGIEAYLLETEGGFVRNVVRQAALVGRNRIFREADELVDANLHRLGELVYQEENRARLEDGVAEALDQVLAHTPAQLLASLPPETLDRLHDQAASWACAQLRRAPVAAALTDVVEREFESLCRTPLVDLVRAAGAPEGVSRRWAVQLAERASGGGLGALAGREAPGLIGLLLRAPVGCPARYLPGPLVAEVTDLALDHLMPVISAQVPAILAIVDVQGLIEREILGFSPEEVEAVILSVARRELRSITWWGGVLGALVGGVQSGLALLG